MKIYVASSWRNIYQPEVVRICAAAGHETYDFRNPGLGDSGFAWSEIDKDWQSWDYERYRALLDHPRAASGFAADMNALRDCDACLLVYPCGKSAHLEMGWACGAGKRTAFLAPHGIAYPTGDEAKRLFKGHTLNNETCSSCTSGDRSCLVPSKLLRDFEPELMAKMADAFLVGATEFHAWLASLKAA